MRDAIQTAIARRLGELADAVFRLKQAVEAGAPVAPLSILRMAIDADAAATVLQSHVERLTPAGTAERPDRLAR